MKKEVLVSCVIFIFLFCLEPVPAFSQEESKEWEPHGSISFTLQERYFGLRSSRELHDGWMLWSNLYLDLPKGFFTNLWLTTGLDDDEISSNKGDEFQPTIGWKTKISGFDVAVSATLFNVYPLEKWWTGDAWVQSFTLSKGFSFGNHTIRPEFLIEYISATNDFDDGAVVLLPNIKHSWYKPFDIGGLTFSHRTMFVWDDGFDLPKNSSDGFFLRWQGGLEWELSKDTTLILPSFTALAPLTDSHDGREGGTSLSASIVRRF